MSRRKHGGKTPRKDQQRPPKETRLDWSRFLPVLVIVVGAATYANSFSGSFLFDEAKDILNSPGIRNIWPLSETLGGRRPVIDLTLAINYALGELNVWGYHLVNVVVHLLAGLTLFGVVRRTVLCGGFDEARRRSAPWLALTISLLWVVHPLQTQSVNYIIQRCESMMGLFYLLALYCVIRGVESPRRLWWYIVAIVSCALGMGSKAVIITAPVMVFLYDRVFISRSFVQMLRQRWGLYIGLAATWSVLAVSGILRGVLIPSPGRSVTVGFGVKDFTPLEYLLTQPGVILHYLRLSLWPYPLCLDYGWPIANAAGQIVGPGIVVLALLAGTIWALWRRPWLGFLGAWFFVILSPTSSFVPLKDPLFEHRMYLSLAAVIAVVVAAGDISLRYVFARSATGHTLRPTACAVLVAVVVLLLGAMTSHRNKDYRSEIGMWQDVIAKRPQNARAHHNLGTALSTRGRYDEAVQAYRQAAQLDPLDEQAYANLARVFMRQGKLGEALEALHQALEIAPGDAKVHDAIGTVYGMQGKPDEAIKWFRQAVKLDRRFAGAHNNLGTTLSTKGLADEAIEHFRAALRLKPRYPDALANLGIELWNKGLHDEAVERLREALQIDPRHTTARWNLGYDLLRLGNTGQAVEVFREGVRVHPRDADAHFHLGQALTVANKLEEALQEHEKALRLQPNHAHARQARDALLAAQGG